MRKMRLTYEQLERLCEIAEEAARKYITSRVPKRRISDISISVDSMDSERLNLSVDVEVRLSPVLRNVDVEELVKGAINAAFKTAEDYLREISCHSKQSNP